MHLSCIHSSWNTQTNTQKLRQIYLHNSLLSHSVISAAFTFTFKHSRTNRLIFAMYDDHIPCNSAVFTFTLTNSHTHTHTQTSTYLHNVWWFYSVHSSWIHIQTHTHTHTIYFCFAFNFTVVLYHACVRLMWCRCSLHEITLMILPVHHIYLSQV